MSAPEGPSIWRDDEGSEARRGATEGRKAPVMPLFGEAEQERAEAPSATQARVDLWRPDEGRPTTMPPLLQTPPPADEPKRVRRRSSSERARPSLRPSWPVVAVATVVFLTLIALADAGVALLGLNETLKEVQSDLGAVEQQLTQGDVDGAGKAAAEALEAGENAVGAARRPTLQLATLVPGLDRDVTALRSLAVAARRSAEAAGLVVDAAEVLELGPEGVPEALYSDGRVLLETADEAATSVQLAERAALEGALVLQDLDPRLAQLRAPLETARERLAEGIRRLNTAGVAFDLMGSLLGGDGGRDYLLIFQAPGEARATGGFAGFAGMLSADEGLLELGDVVPMSEIQPGAIRPVDAPEWFTEAYSVQGALSEWQQANVSPNYPAVADVYLEMYERATGRRLDGVLAMDPFALGSLMEATGAIETRQPARTVAPNEVAEVILHDSYVELTTQQQNRFLTQLVESFWQKVSEGDVDLALFADALDRSIDRQHIKVFSTRGRDSDKLVALGLDGDYDSAGANVQMAFNNNYGANKIDYYLHRKIATDIELQSDGSASVTTTLELHNRAPAGPPSLLVGRGDEIPVGTNRMTINLLLPPGSSVEGFAVGGDEKEPFTYVDEDAPVVWDLLEIPAGGRETVNVRYTIPGVLLGTTEGTLFEFTLFPQTTVNPDTFSLTIEPPPGATITNQADFGSDDGDAVQLQGTLEEPRKMRAFMSSGG